MALLAGLGSFETRQSTGSWLMERIMPEQKGNVNENHSHLTHRSTFALLASNFNIISAKLLIWWEDWMLRNKSAS